MQLPKELTTVTTFSKYLALSMFIIFPILAFFLGMRYSQLIYTSMMPEVVYTRPPSSNLTPFPTPSSDMSDWKIYKNDKFNFSLSYPPNWIELEKKANSSNDFTLILYTKNINKKISNQYVYIDIYKNEQHLSLNDWINKYVIHNGTKSQEIINGIPGVRINDLYERVKSDAVFISKGDNIFRINLQKDEGGQEVPVEVFNNLLSTFKFLN